MRAFAAAFTIAYALMLAGPVCVLQATASRTPTGISRHIKSDVSGQQHAVILPDSYVPGMGGEDSWTMTVLPAAALHGDPAVEGGLHVPLPRRAPLRVFAADLLAAEASRWIGKGPRDLGVRMNLWCADAINAWLRRVGKSGTGSALAKSFASYGRATKPKPGAIAVKPRRGGNHVVVVKAILKHGRLLAISPNGGGGKVRLHVYRIRQFYAFREPV